MLHYVIVCGMLEKCACCCCIAAAREALRVSKPGYLAVAKYRGCQVPPYCAWPDTQYWPLSKHPYQAEMRAARRRRNYIRRSGFESRGKTLNKLWKRNHLKPCSNRLSRSSRPVHLQLLILCISQRKPHINISPVLHEPASWRHYVRICNVCIMVACETASRRNS